MTHLAAIFHSYVDAIYHGVIVIAVGFLIFSLLENMFALMPGKKTWRATFLDLQYAFLSMLYPPFIYFILSVIFSYMALHPKNATTGLSSLAYAGQLLAILFVRDCLIYIRHRFFHLGPVWAFHSIHHSSEEVNWISAARFHPAENIIEATGETALFLACFFAGFDPGVLTVAALTIGFYNFFIHSNQCWTFGPLRYVLVSPVFHRWHHSDTLAARDKNFAAMFSCIDLMLGTFYMPKGILPETLGLSAEEKAVHPQTLAGQLWYPFKKR